MIIRFTPFPGYPKTSSSLELSNDDKPELTAFIKDTYPKAKIYAIETPEELTLICECCGFKQVFKNSEIAFGEGWDCPPHFTGYACCNLCPGSFIVMGRTDEHKTDHKRWEKEGRPNQFQLPDIEYEK